MAFEKRVFSLLLLASLAVLAVSFPREAWRESFNRPVRADDVVIVPLEDRNKESAEDSDEDDYGEGYPSPWTNSFGTFFQGMQAMLQQLRNQMQEVLTRIPQEPYDSTNGTSVVLFPSWNNLPGNSTSTTKVINGHVVTVNETTYKQGSDGSSAVFHIRVVDIKPENPGAKIPEGDAEVETVEDSWESDPSSLSFDNNRPSSQMVEDSWESNSSPLGFEDTKLSPQMLKWLSQLRRASAMVNTDRKRLYKKPIFTRLYDPKSEEVPDAVNSIDNSVDVFHRENDADRSSDQVIDLSRDILVNKLMSDEHKKGGLVALPPDVELLDISNGKVIGESEDSYLQQKFQKPEVLRGWTED